MDKYLFVIANYGAAEYHTVDAFSLEEAEQIIRTDVIPEENSSHYIMFATVVLGEYDIPD